MNSNIIPQAIDALALLSQEVVVGLRNYGQLVGMKQSTAEDASRDRDILFGQIQPAGLPDPEIQIGAQPAYEQAQAITGQANVNLRIAMAAARALCTTATDVLRVPLGRRWSSRWSAAGFTNGSLAVPRYPVARLESMRGYFRTNPTHANVAMGVTEASIEAALATLATAQGVLQNAERAEADAKQDRDEAVTRLRRRLTAVRHELNLLLSADDGRWYDFGFNRPADGRIPGTVANVIVTPGLPGQVQVSWDRSTRADNYRVTRSVAGMIPAETVEIGLFADTSATVTGLPSGSTVIIGVSARNGSGETQPVLVSLVIP